MLRSIGKQSWESVESVLYDTVIVHWLHWRDVGYKRFCSPLQCLSWLLLLGCDRDDVTAVARIPSLCSQWWYKWRPVYCESSWLTENILLWCWCASNPWQVLLTFLPLCETALLENALHCGQELETDAAIRNLNYSTETDFCMWTLQKCLDTATEYEYENTFMQNFWGVNRHFQAKCTKC